MKFFETHEVVISTLSPVHIGCGEDYEPTNYVVDQQTLYAFDSARLVATLAPQAHGELLRLLDNPQPLLAMQRFFYRHRERAIELSSHRVPLVKAAADFYAARVGQVAQRESGGRQVINKLEIARTSFDPASQLPILPGSSLKGAMRTAVLEGLRVQTRLRYPLPNPGNHREASRIANEMEVNLMGGSFATDPFRLVKVSDAAFQPGRYKAKNKEGQEIERERQPRTILFQANRKKRPNNFESRGAIETLVECVPAGQPWAFRASLVIEKKARRGEGTPSLQPDFVWLARACNAFYLPLLNAELKLLEDNGYISATWAKNARARLAETGLWGKAITEDRGFMLRVGRHSGAECVTIDAPRKIKIMKGRNQQPEWAEAPTTVWLAAGQPDATKDLYPFGWVFVQVK